MLLTIARSLRSPAVRFGTGLGISAAFAYAALSRVDFQELGIAFARTAWPVVVGAVGVSALEVAVRALRWQRLLGPLANPGYRLAYALLSIGHLANALLPARLGDVSRALMAGSRLRVSRTSVLGTIAVERVADTAVLALAGSAGAVVGFHAFDNFLMIMAFAAVAAVISVVGAVILLRVNRIATTRLGALLRLYGGRFAAGASAMRRPRELVWVALLSLASFALAMILLLVCAAAVGITLPVWQAGIVIAFLTLSTAIPAGPASVGTYEFVGVAILGSMGYRPEAALVAVALLHAVAVLTPATIGLGCLWALGLDPIVSRFGTRVHRHDQR